jgi:pimeloyl-ACP methyl ester carboxylesterase
MNKRLILTVLALVLTQEVLAAPTQPARNKDGSIVTGVLTAQFDPARGILPFPHNLLFTGTRDLTLNPPVANPNDPSDPAVALSALDGFSPTEKWVAAFVDNVGQPGTVAAASVVPGQSVRVFQVRTQSFVAVTSIVRELTPGVEYTAVASGSNVAIIPLVPLAEYSAYMAVLTNDINDAAGNDATPSQTYFLTKRRTPWVDANGHSTYSLIPDAQAQALEPLRQVTQSMELNAAAYGINPDNVVLAWTVQTQSVTPTLKLLRSITEPAPVLAAPTGLTTAAIGGLGLADIVIGVITLPYYLGVPSAQNPAAPLTDHWRAAPGAYVPPYDQLGLDPTSTNLTFANPFPVLTSVQTVPFILAVPNANSGFTRPAGGWPVVIFAHGITRNRTDVLAVADAIARAGFAVIAMDHPLHGVVPEVEPQLAPFYIENTPFGALANERTLNTDFFNNTTGALQPDGIPDGSGSSFFNLLNFRAIRDNLRQSQIDLSVLAMSLQNISVDGDQAPDLNSFNVGFVGHSYGALIALPFLAVEPIVTRGYLNAGGLLLARTAEAGAFGVRIRALLASAGILPGTPQFEQFLLVVQTVIGSADPAGWVVEAKARLPLIHNQVQGDTIVPNTVAGSPLGGNEGLNRMLGLTAYSSSQADPEGFSGVARFITGEHQSLLYPFSFPTVTAEMQGQMVSFIASGGTFVNVANPSLLAPVAQPQAAPAEIATQSDDSPGKSVHRVQPIAPESAGRGEGQ